MDLVAIKMLVGDRLKYLALVAGIAFAALLITQQASIFMGFSRQIGNWIREASAADLWVMDDQVEFDNDFKPMLSSALQRVRGIEGIEWAVPMYKNYLRVRLPDGTQVAARIIGLDDATLIGGPPQITHGRLEDLRRDRAVFINEEESATTLRLRRAGNRPLRVGDRVSINENDALVVGTFRAGREFFWDPVIYTTWSRALNWAPRERRVLQYILVKARPGQDIAQLKQRIEAATGLRAWTNREFDRISTRELLERTGILVNFGITVALGFLIGTLVAGQTYYSFVLENLRLFGALKAMGAGNLTILRMLMLQVILVGCIGYGQGVGLASLIGLLFGGGALAFSMTWHIPVAGGVAVLLCCMAAGILGMFRVMRMEPAIVFKS